MATLFKSLFSYRPARLLKARGGLASGLLLYALRSMLFALCCMLLLSNIGLAQQWVLQNVQVVDAKADRLLGPKDIYILKNRILQVNPAGQSTNYSGFEPVDGAGRFVIPGLWDMHAHPDDPEVWRMDTATRARDLLMPLFVLHGITGIRDMAGGLQQVFRWRSLAAQDMLLTPKIFACGPLLDGPDPMWDGSLGIDNEQDVGSKADSLIGAGADFLKVYSLLPRETYLSLAEYSDQHNLTMVGHVPFDVLPSEAAQTGMKSQEHLLQILLECSGIREDIIQNRFDYGERTGLDRYIYRENLMMDSFDTLKFAQLIEVLVENNTWITPTLSMWYKNAWFEQELPKDSVYLHYLPGYLRTYWTPEINDHLRHRENTDFIETKKRLYGFYQFMVREMQQSGVNLLCGTDMGANPLCFPGIGVHNELEALVESGLSPAQALLTATVNPAVFLGIDQDYGTVETGKIADLVLLDSNPLLEIRHSRTISAVVQNGVLLDSAEIGKMLEEIKIEQHR